MPRIVLEHVSKKFNSRGNPQQAVRAVHDLSLEVEDGEFLALAGPSGSGKTTTLRLMAGLEEATGGSVRIDGKPVTRTPGRGVGIALVFQSLALYPHLTGFENLAFGLMIRRYPRAEIQSRVSELASWLRLTHCLERRPEALSAGERQRIALGRAVAWRPKVLLLDEPFAHLDAPLREEMRAQLLEARHQLGATVVCVTHDQGDALSLGEKIGVMKDGQIQQLGTAREVYEAPENLFVGTFLGSPRMNLATLSLFHSGAEVFLRSELPGFRSPALSPTSPGFAAVSARGDRSILAGVRPERVRLGANGPAGKLECSFQARVSRVEYAGPNTWLHLESGGVQWVALDPGTSRGGFVAGQEVRVRFDLEETCLFDPVSGESIKRKS